MKKAKPRMTDIARDLGLSRTTVSLCLSYKSDVYGIPEVTRKRVIDHARSLGYLPDSIALSLKKGRVPTVGILFNVFATDNHQQALRHAISRITDGGMGCDVQHYRGLGVIDAVLAMKSKGIHNILVIGLGWETATQEAIAEKSQYLDNTRIFLLDYTFPEPAETRHSSLYRLGIDRYAAYRECFTYLYELGHRRIAVDGSHGSSKERAFHDFLKSRSLTVPGEFHLSVDNTADKFRAGASLAPRVHKLMENEALTAVSLHDDQMAAGLITTLMDRGIRVPADISVLGFDNITAAPCFRVPLSTIDVPLIRMTGIALDAILHNKKTGRKTVLPAKLVIRSSTGEPSEN